MAQIKYLDSRRIMGESDGTDIAPTFEDDFSSDNWTDSDSAKMGVQSGYLYAYGQRDGTNDSSSRSLGTTLNGDFVFRTKVDITSWSAGSVGYGKGVLIGLSTQSNTASDSTAQDSIAISISARQTNGDGFYATWSDNQGMGAGGSTRIGSLAISTGIRYFEIIKNGTTVNYNIYSDNLYSTLVATASQTNVTATGFTYAVIRNENGTASTQSGYVEADIDDWEVFSGVTSVTAGKPSLVSTAGGWVEVGRKTISSPTADDLTITGLPDKRYFMILLNNPNMTNDITGFLRVGNGSVDTTAGNYSTRYYDPQLGNDATYAGNVQGFYPVGGSGSAGTTNFGVGYMANKSDQYKMLLLHTNTSFTSGINSIEMVGKWLNSSQPIERISEVNISTGEFNAGCELIVLAYDPNDTHTTNFWEQLADVTASGSSSNLSSGTITAKKYLWIQAYVEPASSTDFVMTFNNDNATSNGNYDIQVSDNGGTYGTSYGRDNINLKASMTTPTFINLFIVNNSTTKKLCIGNAVEQNTAGASSVPNRRESVGRWNNTSAQITEIDIDSSGGNWGSNSFIRVWGAD